MTYRRIVLVGFSGTGKSTTGRLLADRLGWQVIDLDTEIEADYGCSIPEIFERFGEPEFRRSERTHFLRALEQDRVVISTGGGATATEDAWDAAMLGDPGTLTITLDAAPETIHARLAAQQIREGQTVVRPLLAGDDPVGRIRSLKESRQRFYDRSAVVLPVDRVAAIDVAAVIHGLLDIDDAQGPAVRLDAPSGSSDIYIQPNVRFRAGPVIRDRWPHASRVWIVTDANVESLHADSLADALASSGFRVEQVVVEPGEASKSLEGAAKVYDAMLHGRIERSDLVLALGGGVVGDLGGFIAATVLRGVGLIQMPTSLLAMVDSSVGGKTGINHPAGKNLIGAFNQPPLVLVDPGFLATLPARELRQGWAEVVKHALIQPTTPRGESADLEPFLIRNRERLLTLQDPVLTYALRRNIELKSRVVEADERESGVRAYLNFGHTIGHAIEASDYVHMHGEAVSIGMHAAAHLSLLEGRIDQERLEAITALLASFGLPTRGAFDPDRVMSLIGSDKKRVAGKTSWVLLETGGGVSIARDVPREHVALAIAAVRE